MVPVMGEEEIRQALEDAGCGLEMVERYMTARMLGDGRKCCRLLELRRRELLEEIHSGQRRLDRLDYLRYQEQRKERERTPW